MGSSFSKTPTKPSLKSLSLNHAKKTRFPSIYYTTQPTNPFSNLDSITNPSHLTQTHAHMLRTRTLSATPFHWNCLMRAYLRCNFPPKIPLLLYIQMTRSGVSPDWYTLPIALKAVSQVYSLGFGRQLHCVAVRVGLERHEFCESGFVSFYAKSGEFGSARKVFDENAERKLGSWNAIISGFAQAGRAEDAIGLFGEMRRDGFRPDDVTMVSVLSACGSFGDLCLSQQVHKFVVQVDVRGRDGGLLVENALVDMYGKCGRVDFAYQVFSRMMEHNVSSWTAMIMGFAMHGRANDALKIFRQMRVDGVLPNHVTFVSVLSACAHGGLVDEGMHFFVMMTKEYGIDPTMAHYGCMVDIFGRVGKLEEARAMVERMPMRANSVILGTLLGACEKHGCVNVGKWVANKLIELEPWNDGVYVVLSNIYADADMWEEVEKVRLLMKNSKVEKAPGYSEVTSS